MSTVKESTNDLYESKIAKNGLTLHTINRVQMLKNEQKRQVNEF